jgi:hypothetical protein
MPSYEEAAHAVLGTGADEHLRRSDRLISGDDGPIPAHRRLG